MELSFDEARIQSLRMTLNHKYLSSDWGIIGKNGRLLRESHHRDAARNWSIFGYLLPLRYW